MDDLQQKMRELLSVLCECRQSGSGPTDLEKALCLAMTEITLNRPANMGKPQEAHVELLAEEAERFVSLATTLMLENRDGFSGHQRLLFSGSISDLIRNLEKFIDDTLLIMGDRQEIRRRLQAS